MYLGMTLQVSQSLALRQKMETELTQNCVVTQEHKLVLTAYVQREREIRKLYRKALKRGMVKLYAKHGMKFEYALISAKDVPPGYEAYGWAFSHCLYNKFEALMLGSQYAMARGSWLLFVVYDAYPSMPHYCLEYSAVHERGEQVTLGNHNLASKLEFAIAKKEHKLSEYVAWIEEHDPAKFADIFSYQTHLEFPEEEGFQEILETFSSSEEAKKIRRMIEEFEWPHRILQRLSLYRRRNEEVIEIMTQAMRTAEFLADDSFAPLDFIIGQICSEVAKQLRSIVRRGLKRYVNLSRIDSLWHELRSGVDKKFVEMLHRRQALNPDYLQEFLDSGIDGALPRSGMLSHSFVEVLAAL